MMSHLLSRLAFLAELVEPDALALVDNQQQVKYTDLLPRVKALSEALRAQGARVVAFQGENSVAWALLDLACQAANIVALPLPEFFTTEQILHCLTVSGADLLMLDDSELTCNSLAGLSQLACREISLPHGWQAWQITPNESVRQALPRGTQKITFTSGSTGTPKGVCLSQDHQWLVAESLADRINVAAPKHFSMLPLATLLENIAGIYAPLLSGGTVHFLPAAQRGLQGSSGLNIPAFLQSLSTVQPDTLILIPQLLSVLIASAEKGWQPPVMKFVAVGGARVAEPMLLRARQLGLPVYEGYGLSECASVVSLNVPESDLPGATGKPLKHVEIGVEDGEIIVKGNVFLGYLGDQASWYQTRFATGDLGALDENGFVHIAGRKKNLLISSFGRNINPEWVESTLMAKPLFRQCVVLGDAKPYLVALLALPEGVPPTVVNDWLGYINTALPDYAQVKAWACLNNMRWLPLLTANGRPRREVIAEQLADVIDALYSCENDNLLQGIVAAGLFHNGQWQLVSSNSALKTA